MNEEEARADIAAIRTALEQGRSYAAARSPDMIVWGVAVALGYLGTYAFVRGVSPVSPGVIWAAAIGLPWLYSLRGAIRRLAGAVDPGQRPLTASAMRMLWFGCGIFLTTLGVAADWTGEAQRGWFDAVVAGVLGIGFFASATLLKLAWLRWVAVCWWLGELALFSLRGHSAALPLGAALMLVLLAGPGLALRRRAPQPA